MAARKVVPGDAPIAWEERGPSQTLWQAPVEVEAAQVGNLTLFINPQFPRRWTYKLSLHGNEVYRVDVKPQPVRHSNPSGRPSGCPGKVTSSEHEHRWHYGFGLRCAYPLDALADAGYERILEEFCLRANIDFGPLYAPPAKGFQLLMGLE